MALERANILYPNNGTVVDSGTGIDVRILSATNGGTNDATQTATATHTQDSVERTFDPATAGVTNTNNASTTLFKTGWALRLAEDMTPVDDADCNAMLNSGNLTVNLDATINQSGGTYVTGSYGPTWKASLWRYNPSTDSGTLIVAASNTTTTWNYTPATGDLGTFKTVSIVFTLSSDTEFLAGEILYIQVGLNTGTIPDPTLGTATWTYTLRVDSTNTKIDFVANQNIHQVCVFTNNLVGVGISSRGGNAITQIRTVTGKGISTRVMAVERAFSLVGKGVLTASKATIAAKSFSLVGTGVATRVLNVAVSRSTVGLGVIAYTKITVASKNFSLVGVGTSASSKTTIAAKSFSLIGKGIITEVHPVQAYRTFNLVGKGEILTTGGNATTITLPIDELPTGGGAPVINTTIFAVLD